jgi:hypothetical protein
MSPTTTIVAFALAGGVDELDVDPVCATFSERAGRESGVEDTFGSV